MKNRIIVLEIIKYNSPSCESSQIRKSPMKAPLLTACLAALAISSWGQSILPDTLSFNLLGSFSNPVGDSSSASLFTDNNLTDGYSVGFDLADAPSSLNPSGPVGSAAFQWGSLDCACTYAYPHPSALWYEPTAVISAIPETSFLAGQLYFRNGTILAGTGASAVDLNLALTFSTPSGLPVQNLSFTQMLLNTLNSSDPIASADIVRFGALSSPIDFRDTFGNPYFLELTFQLDADATDGTLSTAEQFQVFEGVQGKANLIGRFTTTPIPEPSSLFLASLGMAFFIRRSRRHWR